MIDIGSRDLIRRYPVHIRVQGIIAVAHAMLVVAGCGPVRQPRVATRDSAGVWIVESSAPADGRRPRYSIDSVPTIQIDDAGDVRQQLGQEVIPTELADGRIVINDPSSAEIRLFDPRGKRLKSFGRAGEGPGEFAGLGFVARFSRDSLVAYDVLARRYSVFDDTGGFARSGLLAPVGTANSLPAGAFQDGSLLIRDAFPLRPNGFGSASIFSGGRAGEQRASTPLYRAPLDGSPPDSITTMPGSEVIVRASGTGGFGGFMWPIHFGKVAVIAARDSLMVIGDGDGFRLEVRRQDGHLLRRFQRPAESRPVTASELDGLIGEQMAGLPLDARDNLGPRLREVPHRPTKPSYDRAVISDASEFWVRHFVTSTATERQSTWSVFSGMGEWLCDMTIPAPFVPFVIPADHLLGTWTDENGEVSVRTYRLRVNR